MQIRSDTGLIQYHAKEVHHMVALMDEFGQDGRPGVFALGLLILPRPGLALLADLLDRVVADVTARNPNAKSVKARDWSEAHSQELCDLIRENRWMVGNASRNPGHPSWKAANPSREALFKVMERDGHHVNLKELDVTAMRELFTTHHPYFDQFYDRLRKCINVFADQQIGVGSLEVIADERIPDNLSKAMQFSAWMALSRRFPQYEASVLNGRGYGPIRFRSSTEDGDRVLLAADALAHWWGMTLIPEEHTGGKAKQYREYLKRMDMDWKPPE